MREAVDKFFKTRIQNPVVNIRMRKIRNLALLLFAAGFFCFFIFGGQFVDDISLLDSTSLKRIRDMQMVKEDYFRYLCLSHVCLLLFCGVLWWYRYGKVAIYALLGLGAGSLGLCLAVSLMRYRIKGVVLWVILYFPHTFFYFIALICGVALCGNIGRSRKEKVTFLLQNITWLLGAAFGWVLGLYCECYIGSSLLQKYLQVF